MPDFLTYLLFFFALVVTAGLPMFWVVLKILWREFGWERFTPGQVFWVLVSLPAFGLVAIAMTIRGKYPQAVAQVRERVGAYVAEWKRREDAGRGE